MRPTEVAELAQQTSEPDRLREMSTSRFTAVRTAVAKNVGTPDDLLEALVADRHHLPRYGVAENLKPSALGVALGAADSSVRVILAQRQDLPAAVVQTLLRDPEREVRISVAESTRDEQVLRTLALDADSQVRSTLPFLELTSDDVIETLSRDPDRNVRACVARSHRASEEQLQRLLRDKSSLVREWVLRYYSRRSDVCEFLANDSSSDIVDFIERLHDGTGDHGVADLVVSDALERHGHRSTARLT